MYLCAITCILSALDRKIEAEERRKAALQALFKTMLHQLMTGKLRVGSGGETNDAKRAHQGGPFDGPHSD